MISNDFQDRNAIRFYPGNKTAEEREDQQLLLNS